ncbi:hypothetical protein BC835DRAFT_730265 [Cytidiella melzeri]|nr:hypothetical protein BC835DRAFT_730265 [Cytidiella melzeri]
MLNRPSKRKADRRQSPRYTQPDPALYIQAHEADVTRGSQALSLAQSLEARYAGSTEEGNKTRLVQWQPSTHDLERPHALWLNRYDVRLLLEALPSSASGRVLASESGRLSPTGWSDLPSDTEDTFFFSPAEAEDYHREKRRRTIDQSREERLKAMRAEAGEDEKQVDEEVWGGSDEEPDEAQKELMRRTATHILSTPNPAQLEMRILANHGADKRFAFLRGRWSRAWKTTKGRVRLGLEAERIQNTAEREERVGLGGLAGYGDSDASEEDEGAEESAAENDKPKENAEEDGPEVAVSLSEDALKEARRARAKEWAEKRRASKISGV